ncbi:MAG: CDF family Co(II)/Ni(II) efflux transporter DmeF [Rhodospirillaceae bacterium]|nr:CDF family Co(II)/Ni(II) efflux transporter DmeF [Rhodospirillaceae bacterium]
MHNDSLTPWQKPHRFLADGHGKNARRTMAVLILTAAMMVAEIVAGTVFGSMALLADGWHMGSHAAALGIAVFAYAYARRHADNDIYTFGTGKVGDLAAFASALLLLMIAGLMAYESAQRLIAPVTIAYNEAILVAVVGLAVNLVSAWMLKDDHNHGHEHDHHDDHAHEHHHHDHNLRAAYVHVITDALTSVLAIVALLAGLLWNLVWMDALMGIVGAGIIVRWAWGLLRSTGRVLLDAAPAGDTTAAVRGAVEAEADNRIADLHVWRVGPGHLAAVLTIVTHHARTPAHYKKLLAGIPCLSHVTVEVEVCCDQKPHAA